MLRRTVNARGSKTRLQAGDDKCSSRAVETAGLPLAGLGTTALPVLAVTFPLRQSARDRSPQRAAGTACRSPDPHGLRHPRRTRLSAVRPVRRPAPVPPHILRAGSRARFYNVVDLTQLI